MKVYALIVRIVEGIQVNLPEDEKMGTGLFFVLERFLDWVFFMFRSNRFDAHYTVHDATKDFFDSLSFSY